MGKVVKIALICLISLVIVGLIGYVVFVLTSGKLTDEYMNQLSVCLAAADNSEGVFVEKEDGEHKLTSAGIKKFGYYAGYSDKISICVFTRGDLDGETINVRIGEDKIKIVHLGDSEDDAVVYFTVGAVGKSYRVKIHYDGYWNGIRSSISDKYCEN